MSAAPPPSRALPAGPPGPVWLFLAAAFPVRLAFGLTTDFWIVAVFRTGRRVHANADSRGAAGPARGRPLFLVAQPEAPYVLLNLLAWHIAGPEPSLDVPALRGRDLVDPEPGRQIQRVVLAENR